MSYSGAKDFFMTGPFAQSRHSVMDFGTSIYFSYLFMESLERQRELEKEYDEAAATNNEEDMAYAKLQITIHETALQLSTVMFEGIDDGGS